MSSIEKFYDNTKKMTAHQEIVDFCKFAPKGVAVDIGCGAGRDTIFLIKNGWQAISVDKEDVKDIIYKQLSRKEKRCFKFLNIKIEDYELKSVDLVVAFNSLPFCYQNAFGDAWKSVVNSIKANGYFIGTFFGRNDDWAKLKQDMVFMSREECVNLFKEFKIEKFEEIEEDNMSAVGENKHWHIFKIVAKKI